MLKYKAEEGWLVEGKVKNRRAFVSFMFICASSFIDIQKLITLNLNIA